VLARLRERGALPRVEAIAITHFHLDHWGDLVPWAWLSAYGSGALARPELWLPPGGVAELESFAERWGNDGMFPRAFELHEYEPGIPFEAAGFEVEARPVRHYTLQAFGFRVRDGASARVLAYSGDTGPSEELNELAGGANLFVCEATLGTSEGDANPRGHLTAEEALAAADGPVLLTHRPAELPAPPGVPVADDGLVVRI